METFQTVIVVIGNNISVSQASLEAELMETRK